ncbi:MAG: hypothetical protein ACOY0T_04090 [Myxococcota bacterium]
MRRARALGSLVLVSLCIVACGSSRGSSGDGASGGASSNAGGKANGNAGTSVSLSGAPNAGANNAGVGGLGENCVDTKQEGKLAPLDLFIMLDISGSMLDPTSARANAPTKWTAVSNALKSFLADPASNGLGVGIQYFPQPDPSVPETCTADAQCGPRGGCFLRFCQLAGPGFYPCNTSSECVTNDGEDVGPCSPLRFCAPLINGLVELCHIDAECAGNQRCQPLNECSNDRSYVCTSNGQTCGTQGGVNLGTCSSPTSTCIHSSSCEANVYAQAAAAIAPLPSNLNVLVSSINAQMPSGDTPTSAALSGAIQAASTWASAHPDHSVVTLLATDGLPTECIANPNSDPTGITGVRAVAASGVSATPSIKTFVIGVFGPEDTDARMNLNQIAMAGGTNAAFLVDTSQDVSAQFIAALNEIRGSRLSCEYLLPAAPSGQSLDYTRVNVDFTNAGTTERLSSVSDGAACGTSEGWYYDQNPNRAIPTKIVLCPATCSRVEAAAQGSVQVALGCQTVVR